MRILAALDERFEEVLGGVLLAIVVFLTFLGVVARLAFSSGLPWQEELTRIMFVLMVYLGASYSIMKSDHIRVTVLVDILPQWAAAGLDMLAHVVGIGFHLALFWLAGHEMLAMSTFPAASGVLKVPLYLVFAIVPAMFLLMAFRQAQMMWRMLNPRGRDGEGI